MKELPARLIFLFVCLRRHFDWQGKLGTISESENGKNQPIRSNSLISIGKIIFLNFSNESIENLCTKHFPSISEKQDESAKFSTLAI